MMEEVNCYCSVVTCVELKNSKIEHIFKDFLEDIKLPFNILEFDRLESLPTEREKTIENRILERNPQSLAICLFLKEDSDLECTLKRLLKTSLWQLDHVIESSLTKRPQRIGRQELYSCSHDMPLMSVCSVHYGNEHVRFHINVKNFHAMKKFYEDITDRQAKECGTDFCFLTIYSEDGLDVQIGLKKNPAVFPIRSTSLRLKFRIQSVSPLFKYLASSRDSTNEANYILQDPDGNDVIIERSYAKSSNSRRESVEQVDENNNFELRILEKSPNSSVRKRIWSKHEYSEHGLFPEEAMFISDDVLMMKYEGNDDECKSIGNRGDKDHITYV